MVDTEDPKPPENTRGLRMFLSPAFLEPLEERTYGLFRSMIVETADGHREKVKKIGPLKVLREAEPGEDRQVVLRSQDPRDGRSLELVEVPE